MCKCSVEITTWFRLLLRPSSAVVPVLVVDDDDAVGVGLELSLGLAVLLLDGGRVQSGVVPQQPTPF